MCLNQSLPKNVSNAECCFAIPAHRRNARDYLTVALEKSTDILWLTVMSQHTTKWLARLFLEKRVNAKTIRVLTLDPNTPDAVIRAFAGHLNEPPSGAVIQVKEAWAAWRDLAQRNPALSARSYESSPTLQGVFLDGREALIEVMSFHSTPDERVGLFITRETSPETFRTLHNAVEEMWTSSRTPDRE